MSSDRSVGGFENIYQLNFTYALPPSYLVRDSTGNVQSVEVGLERPTLAQSLSPDSVLARIDETLGVLDLGLRQTGEFRPPLPERTVIPERVTEPVVPAPAPAQTPVQPIVQTPAESPDQASEEPPVLTELPPLVSISGFVLDQKGGPVSAEVEISCIVDGLRTREVGPTDDKGAYELILPRAVTYSVVVNASGHLLHAQELIHATDADALGLDITLQKLDLKEPAAFAPILFAYESSVLDEKATASLDDVVLTLLNNAKLKLNIYGHALDGGTAAYNKELSEKRARAVVDYLISKGIEKKRLSWKSYGSTRPYNSAISETQKVRNRRVEIEVKS
ncbi:MAG: OmpA family protein [Candidatus Syntrophosphaera sp.]|nr:OmpA family protein [Candidatus Syntrophosphaera sp.]